MEEDNFRLPLYINALHMKIDTYFCIYETIYDWTFKATQAGNLVNREAACDFKRKMNLTNI